MDPETLSTLQGFPKAYLLFQRKLCSSPQPCTHEDKAIIMILLPDSSCNPKPAIPELQHQVGQRSIAMLPQLPQILPCKDASSDNWFDRFDLIQLL